VDWNFDGNGSNLDVPWFSGAQGIPGYNGRHGPGNIMKGEKRGKSGGETSIL